MVTAGVKAGSEAVNSGGRDLSATTIQFASLRRQKLNETKRLGEAAHRAGNQGQGSDRNSPQPVIDALP
jgi:hypothetical protein